MPYLHSSGCAQSLTNEEGVRGRQKREGFLRKCIPSVKVWDRWLNLRRIILVDFFCLNSYHGVIYVEIFSFREYRVALKALHWRGRDHSNRIESHCGWMQLLIGCNYIPNGRVLSIKTRCRRCSQLNRKRIDWMRNVSARGKYLQNGCITMEFFQRDEDNAAIRTRPSPDVMLRHRRTASTMRFPLSERKLFNWILFVNFQRFHPAAKRFFRFALKRCPQLFINHCEMAAIIVN